MFEVESSSGIVGLWDPALFEPPTLSRENAFREGLKHAAKRASLFFLEYEDPARATILPLVGEPIPENLEPFFPSRSGGFRIEVSSGQLVVAEVPPEEGVALSLDIAPGSYLVTPLAWDFDSEHYQKELAALIPSRERKFRQRIDYISIFGCLLVLLGALLVVLPPTRHLWPLLFAVCFLPTFAHMGLERLPRYQRVKASEAEYSSGLPTIILRLERLPSQATAVQGGWWMPYA